MQFCGILCFSNLITSYAFQSNEIDLDQEQKNHVLVICPYQTTGKLQPLSQRSWYKNELLRSVITGNYIQGC